MSVRPEVTGKRPGHTGIEAGSRKPPLIDAGNPQIVSQPEDIEVVAPKGYVASFRKDPPRARGPPPKLALTIGEFCEAHAISEAFYYELQKTGRGPRTMRVGRRRLISVEAAQEWREANTAAA
jgi:hypothetical protein